MLPPGWELRAIEDRPDVGELVRTDSAEVRNDGWVNLSTGAGGPGDRSQNNAYARPLDLQVQLAVALYYCDDLAAKVIGSHVFEALRNPPQVKAPKGVGEETRQAVQDRLEALGWVHAVTQAAIFARALGDAWVFPVAEGDQTGPITPGQRVVAFKNFDRRDLIPWRWNLNPLSPRYGEPDDFQVVAIWGSPQSAYVNHQRLIHFEGVHVDVWERLANGGYNHSVLQRVLPVIRATQQAWDGVTYLLGEASMKVLAVKGLLGKLATARKLTIERIALMNQTASNNNTVAVDSSDTAGEELKRLEVGALSGLAATLEAMMGRLAAAADMDVSELFGSAPTGLGSGEDPNTRIRYARIKGVQTHRLKPQMTAMVELVAAELAPGTKGWSVTFPSLWESTPTEEADLRAKAITAIVAMVTAAICTPEEAAIEIATGEGKLEWRSLAMEARKLLTEVKYEPSPEPTPPGAPPPAPTPKAPAPPAPVAG